MLAKPNSINSKAKNASKEMILRSRKSPFFVLLLILLVFHRANGEEGWTELFDGSSLGGWRGYQDQAVSGTGWSVVNGLLHCDETGPRVDLFSNQSHENFELVVEWKTVAGGQSGIFVHADESTEKPELNAPQIRIEAAGTDADPTSVKAGELVALYATKKEAVKPAGHWNQTRIIAQGERLAVWHNGLAICDATIGGGEWNGRVAAGKFASSPTYGKRLKGPIGLRDSGSKVWFRSVRIRHLKGLTAPKPRREDYPSSVRRITYPSKADQTDQPALFWAPDSLDRPAPLLVALHSWSGGYRQKGAQVQFAKWCQQHGWVFVHPHFRGENWNPGSLGSDLVVGDILSAVAHAKNLANVDEDRIYCVGVSGGGHASMLMAARAPELWAGVSAWCGISNIEEWHHQCENTKFQRYAKHIETVLGHRPEHSEEALDRSPVRWLERNRDRLPALDLWHGVHDGRAGSVPFMHSLRAWNAAVPEPERIRESLIKRLYETQPFPFSPAPPLPQAEGRDVLFRKTHRSVRVSLFEGDHEILPSVAFNWLAKQRRSEPPAWNPASMVSLDPAKATTQSGK